MDSDPQLFLRRDGQIIPAGPLLAGVAQGYGAWPGKGEWAAGRRVTILAETRDFAVGETLRVVHVLEVDAGQSLHVMGPKPVVGEYFDDLPASSGSQQDPLVPDVYDGPEIPGPGVDFNWDITEYPLTSAGEHLVVWRPGGLTSNTLVVRVR